MKITVSSERATIFLIREKQADNVLGMPLNM